jgi:hypothetical protein
MDLDQAIDELYGASLDEFVAERARLAKELRDAGEREHAQTVAKLRKPNVAAWVLNQLSRRNRRDVDLLLDAGHRLREAQAGAFTGKEREGFEQARKTQGDALRRLSREARQLLAAERGGASATILNQVEGTLRTAAISESGRELLARGQFVEPLEASGFDVVSELSPPAPARRTRRDTARANERREAEAALEDAKATLRDAEQAAREAERSADRLRVEWQRAGGAAETLRARADLAAADVEAAERRVKQLRGR